MVRLLLQGRLGSGLAARGNQAGVGSGSLGCICEKCFCVCTCVCVFVCTCVCACVSVCARVCTVLGREAWDAFERNVFVCVCTCVCVRVFQCVRACVRCWVGKPGMHL